MVTLAALCSLSAPLLGSSVDMAIYIHGVFDRSASIAGFAVDVKRNSNIGLLRKHEELAQLAMKNDSRVVYEDSLSLE